MDDIVSSSTLRRYNGKGMCPFKQFLMSRGWAPGCTEVNEYLEGPTVTKEIQISMLSLYACYLKTINLSAVTYLQALRHDFIMAFKDVGIFGAIQVTETRKPYKRIQAREVSIKRDAREKWAITWNMMESAYERIWPQDTQFMEVAPAIQLDQMMALLGGFMLFHWTLRVGNVARTNADYVPFKRGQSHYDCMLQHGCLMEDVFIGWQKPPFLNKLEWHPAHEAYQHGEFYATNVVLAVRSSKTNQYGKRSVKFWVDNSTEGESILVRMIVSWAVRVGSARPDDLFLSRPAVNSGGRKKLLAKEISMMAKGMAITAELPPTRYSAQSFKIGGLTLMNAADCPIDEIMEQADHARSSSSQFYIRQNVSSVRGPLTSVKLGRLASYTQEDIDLLQLPFEVLVESREDE